ncbi:MAG: hypothetical protein HYW85_05785, partial [Deltaproteobacteria bacterium]|nr:hypothetical protein [Deltaproteobacteria bacterium]
ESQATRRLAQQRHAIPAEFPEDLVQYHCVLKVRYLTDEVNRPGRSIWQWQPNLEASGYNIDDISTQLHEELAKRKGQIEEKMYCHKVVFEETK